MSIISFGEMLWDLFPTGPIPGGAPMNLALQLNNLGSDVKLVSRIGADGPGQDLMKFVEGSGLITDHIQQDDSKPTGTVSVALLDNEEIAYKINEDVAWDFIDFDASAAGDNPHMLVYSSLASRNDHSYHALRSYLDLNLINVFDLNLRPPFDDRGKIEYLLEQANILKVNETELAKVADWFNTWGTEPKFQLHELMEKFEIDIACLTLGDRGALLIHEGKVFRHAGLRVDLQDPVGCGDAFLAGFLHRFTDGAAPKEALAFACGTGALVGTHEGATPHIDKQQVLDLLVSQYGIAWNE